MIIVRLNGGLGNQMFQYAAGLRLASLRATVLKLDASFQESRVPLDTPRKFELGCFKITAEKATREECETYEELRGKYQNFFLRILRKSRLPPFRGELRLYRERRFSFDSKFPGLPDNVYLEGFWQSDRYFRDIRDTLKEEFTVREEPTGENLMLADHIAACNSVSLHIRRGDYVTNPAAAEYHGTCGMEYYSEAIEEIKKKVSVPHIFVFSDDPEWTMKHLKPDIPVTFVTHNDSSKAAEDLCLMSLCKHNIIANSSFSWWGAWLNRNPGKVVIAPATWFNDRRIDTKDLIPSGWIRL